MQEGASAWYKGLSVCLSIYLFFHSKSFYRYFSMCIVSLSLYDFCLSANFPMYSCFVWSIVICFSICFSFSFCFCFVSLHICSWVCLLYVCLICFYFLPFRVYLFFSRFIILSLSFTFFLSHSPMTNIPRQYCCFIGSGFIWLPETNLVTQPVSDFHHIPIKIAHQHHFHVLSNVQKTSNILLRHKSGRWRVGHWRMFIIQILLLLHTIG